MKLFTQLALVSAIATCGSAAYAMQSMDDASLSDTTGQDGITIIIAPPQLVAAQSAAYTVTDADGTVRNIAAITQKKGIEIGAAVLHDKDGIRSAANPFGTAGGAIIIGDAKQANSANTAGVQMGIYGSTAIKLNIDASGNGAAVAAGAGGRAVDGTAPVLNIGVVLPGDLMIRTGDISIAGSNRSTIATGAGGAVLSNAATGGTTGGAVKILNSMDIAIGGATMNIQLGNTPQGAMILAGGKITGGLSISGLSLHDGNTALGTNAGDIGVGVLTLTDFNATGATASGYATGADLNLAASIDVVKNVGTAFGGTPINGTQSQGGLLVVVNGSPIDIMMQNVTLGDAYVGQAAVVGVPAVPGPFVQALPAIAPGANSIGDLQLIKVNAVGTTLAIMGH